MGKWLPRPWPQQKSIHRAFPDECGPDARAGKGMAFALSIMSRASAMPMQIENHEHYQLVAVRRDGTEVVLISNLSKVRAASIRASLVDSRAFADIRVEPVEEKSDPRRADSADSTSRAPAGVLGEMRVAACLNRPGKTARPAPTAFVGQQERHEARPRQKNPGGQEHRDD
jgi:hypothetical protein